MSKKRQKFINPNPHKVYMTDADGVSIIVYPHTSRGRIRDEDAIFDVEGAHFAQYVESGMLASAETLEVAPAPEPPAAPAKVDYTSFLKAELQAQCDERNIAYDVKNDRKDDLIAKLVNADGGG